MSRLPTTRRDFLRTGAGVAAAVAVPYTWTSSYLQAQDKNDRPNLACIGVGGMGSGDGRSASRFANVVACADVDKSHGERFAAWDKLDGKCQVYTDYRKVLDRDDICNGLCLRRSRVVLGGLGVLRFRGCRRVILPRLRAG